MLEAGFMDGERGAVFYILHPPRTDSVRGTVLYVHPFAEELNKSRRMVALQARCLADRGFAVLLLDHFGCGDSAGDFGEVDWDIWLSDLARAVAWLESRHPGPLILWGLRTGCLLISDLLASRNVHPDLCLFWQPIIHGELYLTQFLRLRVASGMMSGRKESVKELRHALSAGQSLEVAGYDVSPALAEPLAKARLAPPASVPVLWLEVVMGEGDELPPASRRVVDAWRQQGVVVDTAVMAGEPFWTTQEIREVPALLDETVERLSVLF